MPAPREQARLRALRELNLLDTAPSESFDRITRMASQLFGAPIAAVSLTDEDRQWFKSRVGCPVPEVPRQDAPCAEVTRESELLVVPDLAADPRFTCFPPLQMGARFYAGAPLKTGDGFCLGAMCVLDTKPRTITREQGKLLEDLAAMVMAQIELQHALGRIDPVSGMPNRNQFTEDLEDAARDCGGEQRIAILVELSDTPQIQHAVRVLGHRFLEELVRSSRDTVQSILGPKVILYHVGLSQFMFLVGGLSERALQAKIAEIHSRLKTFVFSAGIPVATDVAIGITAFALGTLTPCDVLRTAFAAALDAREVEMKIATFSPAGDDAHARRFTLLAALGEALKDDRQLSLVYQPRIDMRSGACVSVEALLRWTHPVLGSIPPGEFIPLLEQTALVGPLTEWVTHAALDQVAEWQRSGLALRVSLNVSAANLEEDDFARRLGQALRHHRVRPQSVELEFTESALIRKRARVLAQLGELRAMGVGSAIDDFGTGYSSFSYLQDIPADVVKIDRSFVRALETEERDRTLVKAMIAMAHDLGYRVVTEGIETQQAYDFVAACGCDEAQGYLICRPVPAGALREWLGQRAGVETGSRRRSARRPARRMAARSEALGL